MAGSELVRRYIETFNTGDSTALGAFYTEDVLLSDPLVPDRSRGGRRSPASSAEFRRAFPDLLLATHPGAGGR